jgi:hypothetical protein
MRLHNYFGGQLARNGKMDCIIFYNIIVQKNYFYKIAGENIL